jgi:hypothetical protein
MLIVKHTTDSWHVRETVRSVKDDAQFFRAMLFIHAYLGPISATEMSLLYRGLHPRWILDSDDKDISILCIEEQDYDTLIQEVGLINNVMQHSGLPLIKEIGDDLILDNPRLETLRN